ncbi:MAG: PRC-barrel domain-containing protein [Thermincola sp.]|nr:PRC-barrel domain-containing protein [Thermincola sp.]MDT3702746.1 PRC-barrel domain-containing protein [Thermincola sp.]
MTENPLQVLQKSRDLLGKPVISLMGDELGSVARIIAEPVGGSVVGVTLSVKGWFKGEKAVEFSSISSFGDYALTVKENDLVVPLNTLSTLEKTAQECNLYGMRIITPEGKLIGTVEDYYFDIKTGTIIKYILTGGIIKTLFKGHAGIPAESISKIGKDVIIAMAGVEEKIENEEGGLHDNLETLKDELDHFKNDLGQWKDDAEKVWDNTRSRALELTRTVGENLKTAAEGSKDTGKKLFSKTGEMLTEKKSQLKNSYEMWLDRLQSVKSGAEKPLADNELQALIGLAAAQTITDDQGVVIVAQNSVITQTIIDEAQKAGKLKELLIALATRDLEDQIKSIEDETKIP